MSYTGNGYVSYGLRILTLKEKLEALECCLASESGQEDAAGHLCDLLDFVRKRIKPSAGEPFDDLHEMVNHYGTYIATIKEDIV